MNRGTHLARISGRHFQVLVVGGGITGAGIAWDCALRGLSVALLERTDFAAGTSGVSSKMVHAGLRYMVGDPQLVREASVERQRMFSACPHLVRPVQYLLPAYDDTPEYDARALPGILQRYDELAGSSLTAPSCLQDPLEVLAGMPELRRTPRLVGAYWDGVMDDARVTLEVMAAAAEAGAAALNHAPVVSFLDDAERRIRGARFRDEAPGGTPREHTVTADAVVSAAGPYTDLVLAMAGGGSRPTLRPSRGIHVIFRKAVTGAKAIVVPVGANVLYFLVPFRRGYLAMGCTDTDYAVRGYADLDTVATTEEEIRYTLSLLQRVFPGAFRAEDVVSCYAGVRPLVRFPGDGRRTTESDTSRVHRIWRADTGLWVIAGGKFTTFRLMAEQLVDRVVADLHARGALGAVKPCSTAGRRYHGAPDVMSNAASIEGWLARESARLRGATGLPEDCCLHLCEAYGTAAEEVGSLAAGDPALRERIGEGRPFIMAEVAHAARREMCVDAADFLARRTQLRFVEYQGLDVVEKVVDRLGALLEWDAGTRGRQVEQYQAGIRAASPRLLAGRPFPATVS